MSDEELDDTATTVYEGICGGSGPPGGNQRPHAARGIGLSTLVRRIGRSRDRRAVDPVAESDITAELKRLRRENEILRQEWDVLKKAPLFSPGREVGEVRPHRWGESTIPRSLPVPRAWCQPKRLFRLERSAAQPPPTCGPAWLYLAVVIDLFARRL